MSDTIESTTSETIEIPRLKVKYNDEIPAAVAITEAVSAAGEYSTDASGKFIHGVLGRISEQ